MRLRRLVIDRCGFREAEDSRGEFEDSPAIVTVRPYKPVALMRKRRR